MAGAHSPSKTRFLLRRAPKKAPGPKAGAEPSASSPEEPDAQPGPPAQLPSAEIESDPEEIGKVEPLEEGSELSVIEVEEHPDGPKAAWEKLKEALPGHEVTPVLVELQTMFSLEASTPPSYRVPMPSPR